MMLLYDICYRLYFWLKRFRRWNWPKGMKKATQKLYEWYDYYFSLFLNRKLVPWFEKHPAKWGLNKKKRDERYTVSLTSFPTRIEYVHIAIETLMRQSFKPDNIVLWLAESQFPDKKLPESLVKLESKGLIIRFCEDLKSHKKYFYVFQEYPDDNIILADDDIFYPMDTIQKLVRLHKKYPKDILGVSAQIVAPTLSALPSVWLTPSMEERYIRCDCAQVFTGAGSLFPAGWYPDEIRNCDKAMKIAGTADDLWLKAMSLLAGVKTTIVYPQRGFPVAIYIPDNQTLFSMNGNQGENMNDKVWKVLVEEYGLDRMSEESR